MPLALTCDCGARFEVDDTLAGQEVSCPDCQQALRAPSRAQKPLRTSDWALASAALALIGAFTVIGTIAAVACGLVALVSILRQRDRLSGVGLALFGIVAGTAFTGVTLFAMTTNELFGMGGWLRKKAMADQVDTTGPLEIKDPNFTVSRPSEKWGKVRNNRSDDAEVSAIQKDCDLLLANVDRYAFFDVAIERDSPQKMEQIQKDQAEDLARNSNLLLDDDEDEDNPFAKQRKPVIHRGRTVTQGQLPLRNGLEGIEQVLEVRRGGQLWKFIVRTYQRERDRDNPRPTVYILRAYTPARRFLANEDEMRKALDSFQSTDGR